VGGSGLAAPDRLVGFVELAGLMRGITRAGVAGAVLASAGMLAATASEPAPPVSARALNDMPGVLILAVDLHVHTTPGDGALLPWDLAREARRRGLDAIAITAHNQMIGVRATSPLSTPFGVLLIPGEEITMPHAHVAAVGLDHAVDWRGSIPAIADAVHAQGGVAIAAHPVGDQRASWTDDDFRAVDGVEVAQPAMFTRSTFREDLRSAYAQARQAHPNIAAIGSSDYHTAEPLGFCRTYVFVREATAAGVLDAIRRGRTVACDAEGVVTGPPALAATVADACRVAAAASQATAPVPRLATLVAWIGLVALAFFGFA
jgi:predicted metal-dependent phosphoesterase TrpH